MDIIMYLRKAYERLESLIAVCCHLIFLAHNLHRSQKRNRHHIRILPSSSLSQRKYRDRTPAGRTGYDLNKI